MPLSKTWARTSKTVWCVLFVTTTFVVTEVMALSGSNVCMVQQKYNITKRVKYRAPMSVRTYEWCFSMPPRCSKWSTEMRDLTRLETEERTAEVAVCCPGYKMKDVTCVPICPSGKTGPGCTQDCPPTKWGPNCVNECPNCYNGECSPTTGECDCDDGWQGESCQVSMSTIQIPPALMEKLLTTTKSSVKTFPTTVSTLSTFSTTTEIPATTMTTTIIPTTKLTTTQKTEITTKTMLTKVTPLSTNNFTTSLTTLWTESSATDEIPKVTVTSFIYNRTVAPIEGTSSNLSFEHETSTIMKIPITTKSPTTPLQSTAITSTSTSTSPSTTTTTTTTTTSTTTTITTPTTSTTPTFSKLTTSLPIQKESENTRKIESTTKSPSTTVKFKPKEIWIKPTQKGESTHIETKIKNNHELLNTKVKNATNKNEPTSENTTPKTIIVSIIPTSVSHATFKKIALTTALYVSKKTNASLAFHNKTDQSFTKAMISQVSTATPFTIKVLTTANGKSLTSTKTSYQFNNSTGHISQSNMTRKVITPTPKKILLDTSITDKQYSINKAIATTTMATSRTTNSMPSTSNGNNKKLNSSISLTIKIKPSTNKQSNQRNISHETTTMSIITKTKSTNIDWINKSHNVKHRTNATIKELPKIKKPVLEKPVKFHNDSTEKVYFTKTNVTKISNTNKITTQEPPEDETFHILTEPEHITAVMSDKDRDHTSMDLISVISIAGGVMMAVITVAVVIVMVERCKRHRYDDVRKINDIRMQVMIDNNEVPPPYVRSIFHTPLPDPPHSDKCHYQPISTLDRNLKQFMRPVVVQTISPVMLENFREILECHYDHLPQRNYDFGTMPTRCSVSPSMRCDDELLRQRPLSVADYTIEALKREAKLDVIDNTTSEPLYAEIPCWRPPSEHAIAVVNLNGEAVTEL